MAGMTRQQLEAALQNPNVKKMLDVIGHTEGTDRLYGYTTLVGNTGGKNDRRITDLSKHPNVVGLTTGSGPSTGFGRYQIVGTTWRGLQKKYGFQDFSPKSQDMAAVALMAENGALNDVMGGNFEKGINKLGDIWVSLPSSTNKHQGKRSWASVGKLLNDPNLGSRGEALAGQTANIASAPDIQVAPVQLEQSAQVTPLDVADSKPQVNPQLAQAAADRAFAESQEALQIKPLVFEPVQSPSKKYEMQLASAFGEYPDMSGQIPDEIDTLIQSVYDAV